MCFGISFVYLVPISMYVRVRVLGLGFLLLRSTDTDRRTYVGMNTYLTNHDNSCYLW